MFLVIIPLLFGLFCLYTSRNHNYWAQRNVKHDRPLPFFGNHLPNLLLWQTKGEVGLRLYTKYSEERMVGYYRGSTPELIIRDPEILKYVMNQDFKHFNNRGTSVNPKRGSLLYNSFFVSGDHWRLLRQVFTAAFSPAKLRAMYPLVGQCAEKLQQEMERLVARAEDIDALELMGRFTMEFIGSCGFGIELDIADNAHFVCLAKSFFDKTKLERFLINLNEICSILQYLPVKRPINEEFRNAIVDISRKVCEQRNFKPSGRNDFMDILLEMRASGNTRTKSAFEKNGDSSPVELELNMDLPLIAAQVFLFLVAGFETSASTISFLLYQLAYHQEIQRDIQKEIDIVGAKYGNILHYDAITEMKLLEMSFKEAMRILPTSGVNSRICTKKYTIPGTNVTIDPGVTVIMPVQALHHDPKYFDNPSEFRPERFTAEAEKSRPKFIYSPFGEGPRKCPGARLAYMQSLSGLAALLQRFSVEPAPSSRRQYTIKRSSYLVQVVDGGLPLRFKPRLQI